MSTHKHIDAVCAAIVVFTLLITVLFMNGEAIGITVLATEDNSDEMFTANDLNSDWDTSGATRITLSDDGSKVSGNGAYVNAGDVYIIYAGKYVLSGELGDGSIIVDADGDDRIWLMLDGVSVHCEDDAAIRIEQADKVFMTLREGTENTISSGSDYSSETVSAGVDGAIYSRDDLTINGSGSLSVTAEYQHGIVCNDDLVVTGGTILVTAAQDAIHANDSVRIKDAHITLTAGDDGVTASNDDETSFFYMESGDLSIPACYEGIEAVQITIAGGTIDISPTDDGLNANGYSGNSAINIVGGDITITDGNGQDADGIDSNKDIFISGGRLLISVADSGGSCAIDYGSENGGVCEISGGTVVACGSSGMAEGFDSTSTQGFIMYNVTASAGTDVAVRGEDGSELVSWTVPFGFSSVIVSTPEMSVGDTCVLVVGESEIETVIDNSGNSGTSGFGGFGGSGGRGDSSGGKGGSFFGGMGGDMTDGSDPAMDGAQKGGFFQTEGEGVSGWKTGAMTQGTADAGTDEGVQPPEIPDGEYGGDAGTLTQGRGDSEGGMPELPQDMEGDADTELPQGDAVGDGFQIDTSRGDMDFGDIFNRGGMQSDGKDKWSTGGQGDSASADSAVSVTPEDILLVGVSALVLLAGCLIALLYKRRR